MMLELNAEPEEKNMESRASLKLVIALVVLVIGGLVFWQYPEARWGSIGFNIDVFSVLLLLFREFIREYGLDFESREDSEKGLKPQARKYSGHIYSLAFSLLILGVFYQFLGNPSSKLILYADEVPKGLFFVATNEGKLRVDLKLLNETINGLLAEDKSLSDKIENISHPELLVFNCGDKHKKCSCPESYSQVQDKGGWNLNSGAGGDYIRLCYK